MQNVSVANKGSYNLEAHNNITKDKKQIHSYHTTPQDTKFFLKQN
jgi:hypothetical protein